MSDEFGATLSKLESMLQKEEIQLKETKRRIQAIRTAMEALSSYNSSYAAPALQRPHKQRIHKSSLAHLVRCKTAEILTEYGRPLTRAEIFEQLQARGVTLTMKNPEKRVSKILWDASEFQNSGNGYWLTDHPLPQGEHSN